MHHLARRHCGALGCQLVVEALAGQGKVLEPVALDGIRRLHTATFWVILGIEMALGT